MMNCQNLYLNGLRLEQVGGFQVKSPMKNLLVGCNIFSKIKWLIPVVLGFLAIEHKKSLRQSNHDTAAVISPNMISNLSEFALRFAPPNFSTNSLSCSKSSDRVIRSRSDDE